MLSLPEWSFLGCQGKAHLALHPYKSTHRPKTRL
jgi:hypothetical protein